MGSTGHVVVEYRAEKWGGGSHHTGRMHVLGEDGHGTWLWGPAGRTISGGPTGAFVAEYDVVIVVPDQAWWSASWWIDHPEVALYVNINTPAVRTGDVIRYVDLDLDVVRLTTGATEIVDQDEFAVHQVQLGYPPDVIAATEAAADEVLRAVQATAAPFDGAAARSWTAIARAAGPAAV